MLKRISILSITANFFILIIISIFSTSKVYGISQDYETNNRRIINTLHFDIYYPDEISDLALYTAKAAEDSYVFLANCFKHEITAVIPIVVHYGDPKKELENFNRIDLSFNGSYASLHKELTHRMVHSFQYNILFNSTTGWEISYNNGLSGIPEFITEGMAEYLSSGYDELIDKIIRKTFNSGEYNSLMNIKALNKQSGDLVYTLGQSFFYFLESTIGQDIFGELILNIRDNDNIYGAIEITTRKTIEELNEKWIDLYKQRNSSGAGERLNTNDDALLKKLNEFSSPGKEKKYFVKNGRSTDLVLIYDSVPGKEIAEIKLPFNRIKELEISNDGQLVLFIGQSYSSADVYLYEIQKKILTRLTNDRFEKRSPKISSDNSFVIFISNENDKNDPESIDFKLIKLDLKSKVKTILAEENTENKSEGYNRIKYPASYFDIKDSVLSDYSDSNNLNLFFKGGSAFWNNGVAGSMDIEAADFLKENKIKFNADFLGYKNNKNINYSLDYDFLKYYFDFGAEIFYKTNPLQQNYPDPTVQFLTFYTNNINSKFYGINGFIGFPLMNELSLMLKVSSIVYEDVNYLYNYGKNIFTKQIAVSLNYDSLIYNKAWPVSGVKSELSFSEDFDLSKREHSLNIINFNFIKLFQFDKICVFSVKGSSGKISGRDDEFFKYYIGGFNSIRGHELFEYSGQKAFLFSTELRFIILDRFTIRWPAEIKFNDVSIVLFADFGSAWNNNYKLTNPDSGEFEDLKSGVGTGLRFLLQDHIVFKLDAVWPYFYKSFGKREFLSGFEFKF